MAPAKPPFPGTTNLPFHEGAAGIHSSILMSESLEGLSVAVTRQNAGRPANWVGPRRRPVGGGTYAPAATVSAAVIVVLESESDRRLSHVAAPAGDASIVTAIRPAEIIAGKYRIISPVSPSVVAWPLF